MKTEIWMPIEGYEDLYEVSNEGRVSSKRGILRPVMNNCGYLQVQLWKDGKRKWFKVHRLVATAFVPNMFGDDCVNHIDENKTNNRADNLMWCTHKENDNYGTRNKRIFEKTTNGKLSKTVYQFSKDGEFIREWPSTNEIQRVLGFYQSAISKCCNGKLKSAHNFIWRYKTDL